MNFRKALGFVAAMAFMTPVLAESPFVGRWTATAAAPTGPTSETVNVEKAGDGYAITAKLVEPVPGQPEAGPGKDIVLEGNNFSYKRTLSLGGNEIVILYTGVVSGDTFTGMIEITGVTRIPFTGVRIQDGK